MRYINACIEMLVMNYTGKLMFCMLTHGYSQKNSWGRVGFWIFALILCVFLYAFLVFYYRSGFVKGGLNLEATPSTRRCVDLIVTWFDAPFVGVFCVKCQLCRS